MDSLAPPAPPWQDPNRGHAGGDAAPGPPGQPHLLGAPGRGVAGRVFGLPQRHPLPAAVKGDDGLDGVVCGEEEEELVGSGGSSAHPHPPAQGVTLPSSPPPVPDPAPLPGEQGPSLGAAGVRGRPPWERTLVM